VAGQPRGPARVAVGQPKQLRYQGAAADRIAVTLEAPELPGLYRLTFADTGGAALGFDDFFVQEPA
jgi:hypothetical protein